ncbi:hypothetical protein, partial [Leyella stercorea]|uniref:hypothetical protein n=1 Tax=Leyella stercorea TaxID=363265 RepID=UPI003AF838A1
WVTAKLADMDDFFAYRLILGVIQGVHVSQVHQQNNKLPTKHLYISCYVGALETSAPPEGSQLHIRLP